MRSSSRTESATEIMGWIMGWSILLLSVGLPEKYFATWLGEQSQPARRRAGPRRGRPRAARSRAGRHTPSTTGPRPPGSATQEPRRILSRRYVPEQSLASRPSPAADTLRMPLRCGATTSDESALVSSLVTGHERTATAAEDDMRTADLTGAEGRTSKPRDQGAIASSAGGTPAGRGPRLGGRRSYQVA
jgi:hypothetical protein